jgi:hypothetical protein
MCRIGDIILVNGYQHRNQNIDKHSFVVLSTEHGRIQGLEYNLVCNVMSSFKNEQQKQRKLGYPGNIEILDSDRVVPDGNNRDGYIKAEQFYYFDKEKLDYQVIGNVTVEFFNLLIAFINELDIPIEHIIDNLEE